MTGLLVLYAAYLLSRSTVTPVRPSRLPRWRRWIYVLLKRNAVEAGRYFHLPPGRVLDIGLVIEI